MGIVLLSFLGTGQLIKSENKEKDKNKDENFRPMRDYRTATYKIDNKLYENYTFMSLALAEHYKVNKVLMVGTVHSMWEELYRRFFENSGDKVENSEQRYNLYCEIGDYCKSANHDTDLVLPHKEAVEKVMGDGSKVILVRYGINEREIQENISIILRLQEFLDNEDELIVDISHAFRSLPIFVMNLLIYLQNVSPKKIKILHIHYGMIEAYKEFNDITQVVDLKAMMDVQEWITAAYAFSMFGNAYKIAELLGSQDEDIGSILESFSDTMNLNLFFPIQQLSNIKDKQYHTDLPKQIINPVVEQYVQTFTVNNTTHEKSFFQFKLADWQFKHKKYGQAFLTSNEALITFVCELNNMDWTSKNIRNQAKQILWGKKTGICTPQMQTWFDEHNKLRNGIAHPNDITQVSNEQIKEIIQRLEDNITKLKEIMNVI